jgi:hypothetical protein
VIGPLSALLPLVLLLFSSFANVRADGPDAEFFEKRVRPILAERCLACHGGEKTKGGLKLTDRAAVLMGGDSGPAAVTGSPDDSLIIQAIHYRDEPRMPPKGKLSDAEIATLTRWVERGLPWTETKAVASTTAAFQISDEQRRYWAFQPVRDVSPPAVRDGSWPREDLDRFILAKLETEGLRPAPRADKRTLIRRATFDLTGLPPTPAEVAAFLGDESPDAFARVVDRLLSSPAYGERWARHWLDVVRYADSLDSRGSGQPGDILDAWRYRDWVVGALNADMPYDRFVQLQVAGDLLPPLSAEEGTEGFNRSGTIATTMLAIGNWGNGDADKDKILTDIADDQVDVISKAFMGLTVSCARCHDHKFDPISQRDYYALAGIFFSTHILPKLTPKGAGETIIRVPLASQAEMARREERTKRLAELESKIKAESEARYAELARALRPEACRYLLALAEYQRRPEGTLAEFAASRDLHPFALRRWSDFVGLGTYKPMTTPVKVVHGASGVVAWKGPGDTPSVTANANAEERKLLTFRLPPRSISVHPGPTSGVVVGWKSPIEGEVRVSGSVADGDPAGGDGIAWAIDHRSAAGSIELASGDVANGGSQAFASGKGADRLASVMVRAGDWLQLVVLPKGSHTCDTTAVDLMISDWKSGDTWDLTRDVVDDLLAGNPHADHLGHADVWRFEDMGGLKRGQSTEKKELDEAIAAWRRAIADGADGPRLATIAEDIQKVFDLDDSRSPFWVDEPSGESALSSEARATLTKLRAERDDLKKQEPPPFGFANAAQDGGVPESPQAGHHDVRVHIRGRYDRLGDVVPRGFLGIVDVLDPPSIREGSGRRELADWLTRPDHPLTARVMVNRVWQHHFGAGIVRTPSNFGLLGERPTHPELLDNLALRFVAEGWSLKALHRTIMLSSTYQQASITDHESQRLDTDNRLFGRMNRRRLESEALRDFLLAAAGTLDPTRGGPAVRDFNRPRRGLYMITIRSDRATYGALFDQADSTAPVDQRTGSTVAPQALFLLNNPFALAQANALAQRLQREKGDDPARIAFAYEILYGRPPRDEEAAIGRKLLAELGEAGWEAYAQVLLCANEFLYID